MVINQSSMKKKTAVLKWGEKKKQPMSEFAPPHHPLSRKTDATCSCLFLLITQH